MNKYFLVLLVTALFLSACEKDKTDDDQSSQDVANYYPLEKNNYWVYEVEHLDQTGTPLGTAARDCVVIVSDTTINNHIYYKRKTYSLSNYDSTYSPTWKEDFLRDSANYLINEYGSIQFAQHKINDTIHEFLEMHPNNIDTLYQLFVIMKDPIDPLTVGAGTFDVLDAQSMIYSHMSPDNVPQPLIAHNYFAEDVGLIYFDIVFTSGYKITHRLKHYKLF